MNEFYRKPKKVRAAQFVEPFQEIRDFIRGCPNVVEVNTNSAGTSVVTMTVTYSDYSGQRSVVRHESLSVGDWVVQDEGLHFFTDEDFQEEYFAVETKVIMPDLKDLI